MLFHTPLFLFLFLPFTLATVLTMRAQWREFALLCWSVAFYFWGEPQFFWIILLSSIADYFICQQIFNSQGTPVARNYVVFGVILNVMILLYFKYVNFLLDSINAILNFVRLPFIPLLNIALPIGVSFIIFEKITYLVDVYRGHSKPAISLHRYLLYILLFPKLLAGPIVKYPHILHLTV